ncbi:hypothetical protein ACFWIJ_12445 [Streptomyces sp. NPDC127079]|uniref:hypothetical protein n=1 Tax=Streptomyces sp. NPDC127079 TaxID=3347132 RepID=UPI00364C3D2A
MNPVVRSGAAARAGALLVLPGPLVSWGAEFGTAAARQDPPYQPLYDWGGHLGPTGPPGTAFGQVANSPLGAVIHPIMIGHALPGSGMAVTRRHRATHPTVPPTARADS